MSLPENKPLSLTEKAFWSLINGIERRLFSERFIVANQTPCEVIYSDRIMSVRRYESLEEPAIRVGDETLPVATTGHRIPLVLVPPLAATSPILATTGFSQR